MSQNFIFVDTFVVGQQVFQKYSKDPKPLKVNPKMLKELDVQYLFSSIPLTNDYLHQIKVISSKYWGNIYIYKIDIDFIK